MPLQADNVLGRIALQADRAQIVRISPAHPHLEATQGLPTCYAPIRSQDSLLGVFVADCPLSGQDIPEAAAQFLDHLGHFAGVTYQGAERSKAALRSISLVSHELRTPLSSVSAFGEMLADGDAGPLSDKQERFVGRIIAGTQQLLAIVEDLLEMSRLQLNTVVLAQDRLQIRPLLDDTALNFLPQAIARRDTLRVEAPDDLPVLVTDQRRLQQALSNFVDNAIKYSPDGSEIRLMAELDDDCIRIAVIDQGPGIPAEYHGAIFEEFCRGVQDGDDRGVRGSGLGLSIVQRLAQLLGARIEMKTSPGAGSSFALIFPRP